MNRAGNIAKKLSVLEVINEHKDILFSDKTNKKEVEEAWTAVIEKAQSVGLAGNSRKWHYAKNLFETWKFDFLTKIKNDGKSSKKTPTKLNEADKLLKNILETKYDIPMEHESSPISDVNNSPTTSKNIVSRKRRTEIEIPMEVSEVTCSFSSSKNDNAKKRRTICATTNSPNIKRLNFTINPDTSLFQIKENLGAKSPTILGSPTKKPYEIKKSLNDSFSTSNFIQKTTRDSFIKTNLSSKLNDAKCLDYSLDDAEKYLRRLKIFKLEKELGLANNELAAKNSNDVEMYYRRLQILKLETELNLTQSKYTEDFVE